MQNALRFFGKRSYAIIGILLTACIGGAWVLAAERLKKSAAREVKMRVDRAPIRGELGPLRLHLGEFEFACTRCHRPGLSAAEKAKELKGNQSAQNDQKGDFPSMPVFWSGAFPHADMKLDHGRNDQCFDCHNKNKRDTYIANDGNEIPHNESHKLCSKCHGPVYRDWLRGIHGRREGAWDAKLGKSTDLACIQCHNPHSPAFQKIKPMPPPYHRDDHAKKGEA